MLRTVLVVLSSIVFLAFVADAKEYTPIPGAIIKQQVGAKKMIAADQKCWCRTTSGYVFCAFVAQCTGDRTCGPSCNQ